MKSIMRQKGRKARRHSGINFRRNLTAFFILPGFIFSLSAEAVVTSNDPFFREQWYLGAVGVPTAWERTTGSREVIVAVIDTGVDIDHPDLAQNMWQNHGELPADGLDNDRNGFVDDAHGWNFVEETNDPRPVVNADASRQGLVHGTLLAGIIAAVGNNGQGVSGIGWQTRIMPLRALESNGSGNSDDVRAAIDYAVRNGAKIINLSFTTFNAVPEITEAIRRAKDAGVLIVAAAGNDESLNIDTKLIYPVCTDGPAGENWVLGVASINRFDRKSSFSNYGSLCVDLSAPGEEIFGTQFSGPTRSDLAPYGGYWAGTSLATPVVSGIAALVRAVRPTISRAELMSVLKRTAFPLDQLNPEFRGGLGAGRADAAAAVEHALALVRVTSNERFALASDGGFAPRVWLLDSSGAPVNTFLAYGEAFRGGVRLASGDVDGNGQKELITGAGPGGGPHLRIFNLDGTVKGQFFAFVSQFRGGITVAAGDLDNDGRDEIVVGAGRGIAPTVKVFDGQGNLKSQFLAYAATFTGGVEVLVSDVDHDGMVEIITAAGPGGGPHLRIFNMSGALKGQFFGFETSYRGGVRLGSADVDGDERKELLLVRGSPDTREVRVVSPRGMLMQTFTAFASGFRGPLAIGATDRDGDGRSEIIVAASNGSGELRGFNSLGSLLSVTPLPGELKGSLRLATF